MSKITVGTNNESEKNEWISSKLAQIKDRLSILDAGAGELANKKFCTHLSYTSQDFCQYEGKGDSSGLQTGKWDTSKIDIVSDITSIPVENESFDNIVCTEVLEHTPSPIEALSEFHRILKMDGELFITVPFCSLTHFAPFHFYSGFNKYFYTHHLEQLGFEIIEIKANGNFFEFLAQELRRTKSIAHRYSTPIKSFVFKMALKVVLGYMQKLSKNDNGSSELLCFGYFIHAKKKC